jgi:hypothetical protein
MTEMYSIDALEQVEEILLRKSYIADAYHTTTIQRKWDILVLYANLNPTGLHFTMHQRGQVSAEIAPTLDISLINHKGPLI